MARRRLKSECVGSMETRFETFNVIMHLTEVISVLSPERTGSENWSNILELHAAAAQIFGIVVSKKGMKGGNQIMVVQS